MTQSSDYRRQYENPAETELKKQTSDEVPQANDTAFKLKKNCRE